MEKISDFLKQKWIPIPPGIDQNSIDYTKYDIKKFEDGTILIRNKNFQMSEDISSRYNNNLIKEQDEGEEPSQETGWTKVPFNFDAKKLEQQGNIVKFDKYQQRWYKKAPEPTDWIYFIPSTEENGNRPSIAMTLKGLIESFNELRAKGKDTSNYWVMRTDWPNWVLAKDAGVPQLSSPPQAEKTFEEKYEEVPCVTGFAIIEKEFDGYPKQKYFYSTIREVSTGKDSYIYFTNRKISGKGFIGIIEPNINGETRILYNCGQDGNVSTTGYTKPGLQYEVTTTGYSQEDAEEKLGLVKNYNESFGLTLFAYKDIINKQILSSATDRIIEFVNDDYRGDAIGNFYQLLTNLKEYYGLFMDQAKYKDLFNFVSDRLNDLNEVVSQKQEETKQAGFVKEQETKKLTLQDRMNRLKSSTKPVSTNPNAPKQELTYPSTAKLAQMKGYNPLIDPDTSEEDSYDIVELTKSPFTKPFSLYKFKKIEGDMLQNAESYVVQQGWNPEQCSKGLSLLVAGGTGRYGSEVFTGQGYSTNKIKQIKFMVCRCKDAGYLKSRKDIENLNTLGNLNKNPLWQIDCTAPTWNEQPPTKD